MNSVSCINSTAARIAPICALRLQTSMRGQGRLRLTKLPGLLKVLGIDHEDVFAIEAGSAARRAGLHPMRPEG